MSVFLLKRTPCGNIVIEENNGKIGNCETCDARLQS